MQREPRDVVIRLPSRLHSARETTPTALHAAMRANRPGCGPRHVADGKARMASDDDDMFSAGTAPEVRDDIAAPVKKAAAKRAPRKATKKASTTAKTAESAPVVVSNPAAEAGVATTDEPAAPARKAAKRAPRKSAKKTLAPPLDLESAPTTAVQAETTPEPAVEKAPEVQNFGLFFQPPAPTEAPRRRRATMRAQTKPAGPTSRSAPTPPRRSNYGFGGGYPCWMVCAATVPPRWIASARSLAAPSASIHVPIVTHLPFSRSL